MNLQLIIQEYPTYLRDVRDAADNTVKDYLHDANRYIDYFRNKVDPTLNSFDINPKLIRGYLIYLRSLNNDTATIERRLHGLAAFWMFMHDDHGFSAPLSLKNCGIRLRKKRKPTTPIPSENYSSILEIIDHEISKIK